MSEVRRKLLVDAIIRRGQVQSQSIFDLAEKRLGSKKDKVICV